MCLRGIKEIENVWHIDSFLMWNSSIMNKWFLFCPTYKQCVILTALVTSIQILLDMHLLSTMSHLTIFANCYLFVTELTIL